MCNDAIIFMQNVFLLLSVCRALSLFGLDVLNLAEVVNYSVFVSEQVLHSFGVLRGQ